MPEAPQTVRSLAKLDFTTQAEDILTPFRRKALRLLLKAAVASQTKTKVLSASVDAWSPSEEDAFPSLDLLLSVKGNAGSFRGSHQEYVSRDCRARPILVGGRARGLSADDLFFRKA